jgi:hypothetical protein
MVCGYQSTNEQMQSTIPDDPLAVARLEPRRGVAEVDQKVGEASSWATRKDYEIHVGISLETADAILDASHGIQYWESTKFLPPIGWTSELYDWSKEQLRSRSKDRVPPRGMPRTFEWIAAQVQRKGDGAYVHFSIENSLEESAEVMPVALKVDCAEGSAVLDMQESYTMRMSAPEFMALAPSWCILSQPCVILDYGGWAPQNAVPMTENKDFTDNDQIVILRTQMQE